MGPTMDMQICRETFDYVVAAASILNVDKAFADSIRTISWLPYKSGLRVTSMNGLRTGKLRTCTPACFSLVWSASLR